jgi:hypothetical protein
MDSKGFRLNEHAEAIFQPSWRQVKQETTRETEATKTIPVSDSRYLAYSAPMEDGRHVTDYRQACVTRSPPGTQYAVKEWTIKNADKIIDISRSRQVQNTGHAIGGTDTSISPQSYQQCTPVKCNFYAGVPDGIGIERVEPTPELFGTFIFSPDLNTMYMNTKNIELTHKNEYGRNTSHRWNNLYA